MINDICNYLNRLKPFNCTGHSLPLTGDFFSTFVSPLSPLKRKSVPVIKLSLMSSLTIINLYNKCADKKSYIFINKLSIELMTGTLWPFPFKPLCGKGLTKAELCFKICIFTFFLLVTQNYNQA